MIQNLKYYQGCTLKELYYHLIFCPFRYFFYRNLYRIWLPEEVTAKKTPFSYLFKIIGKDGFDFTDYYKTIIKYNSKTKTALIAKIDGNKLVYNLSGEILYDIIYLPNSFLKFIP